MKTFFRTGSIPFILLFLREAAIAQSLNGLRADVKLKRQQD
jgi:hypothetical protein